MKWVLKFLAAVLSVFVLACLAFYLEFLFLVGLFLHIASFKLIAIPIIIIFVITWKLPGWFKL